MNKRVATGTTLGVLALLSIISRFFCSVVITILILVAIQLGKEILSVNQAETMVTDEEEGSREQMKDGVRGYLVIGVWLAVFALAIYLVGLTIAIALFIISYAKTHGTRLWLGITFALLTAGFIYGMFGYVLGLDLYEGLLISWLGS